MNASNSTILTLALLCGSAAAAQDLSKYRTFPFGANVAAIIALTGASPTEVKVIQSRPALLQELSWRPQSPSGNAKPETVKAIVFQFYNDRLFRMASTYDRYETEGLTRDDLVQAISLIYGEGVRPAAAGQPSIGVNGEPELVVAHWQNTQNRFELIESSYGPSFRLLGVQGDVELAAETSISAAKRLDEQEAPQREAAKAAREAETERLRLEQLRAVNKTKFKA